MPPPRCVAPVVAEGVETEAQRALLEHEGCGEMQGYLIGRPEPIEQYCDLIGINVERRRYALNPSQLPGSVRPIGTNGRLQVF
ncbi:putative signal transduction protein with EAL and GGDEF domain [Bradyrhizobium sp. S3.2.6]